MQQDIIYDAHDCKSHKLCIVAKGWQAGLCGYKVLLQAFFSISALTIEKMLLTFRFI
jgi:hypothetical protein